MKPPLQTPSTAGRPTSAARAIIYQNLLVSLGVIALLLLTSVSGFMQLSWAVIFHEGSTLVVVINALRLLGYKQAVY